MSASAGPLVIDETHVAVGPAAAEALLRRICADARIRSHSEPFRYRQRTVGDDRLQVTSFQVSSDVHLSLELEGRYGVGVVHEGQVRATSNGSEVDTDAAFLLSPGVAEAWTSPVYAQLVGLDLDALRRFAGADEGIVSAAGSAPVSPEQERLWRLTLTHVTGVLEEPALLSNDLIRQSAIDAVFGTALSAFGIRCDTRPETGRSSLRRAMEYIDANLADPLSVADIASATGLGVRGLQSIFARTIGVSPAVYLRSRRLEEARKDLLSSSPTETTVAAIARRWGFVHLSRFAQRYHAEFGEQPSETLRR